MMQRRKIPPSRVIANGPLTMAPPSATADYAAPLAAPSAERITAKISRWIETYSGDRRIKGAPVLTLVGLWDFGAFMLPSSVMPTPHVAVGVLWQEVSPRPSC